MSFQGVDFFDDDQKEQIGKTASEPVPNRGQAVPRSQLGAAHGHAATEMASHE